MKLPGYPVEGEPVTAAWGRNLIDYLRAITPRASRYILPSVGPNGTVFGFAGAARAVTAGAVAHPFKVSRNATAGFDVAVGRHFWWSSDSETVTGRSDYATGLAAPASGKFGAVYALRVAPETGDLGGDVTLDIAITGDAGDADAAVDLALAAVDSPRKAVRVLAIVSGGGAIDQRWFTDWYEDRVS